MTILENIPNAFDPCVSEASGTVVFGSSASRRPYTGNQIRYRLVGWLPRDPSPESTDQHAMSRRPKPLWLGKNHKVETAGGLFS